MPSSHGGGFGGGGSFGGGFHSSGPHSSGNNTPTYSRRPFPGATRYSYINRHGMMCYFFFAGTPRRIPRTNMILLFQQALQYSRFFVLLPFLTNLLNK